MSSAPKNISVVAVKDGVIAALGSDREKVSASALLGAEVLEFPGGKR